MGNICGVYDYSEDMNKRYNDEKKYIQSHPANIIAKKHINNFTENKYQGYLSMRGMEQFTKLLYNIQNNDEWNNLILKILIYYIGYVDDDYNRIRRRNRTDDEIILIRYIYWITYSQLVTLICHHMHHIDKYHHEQYHNNEFNSMIYMLNDFIKKIKNVNIEKLSVIELEHSVFALDEMAGFLRQIIGFNDHNYHFGSGLIHLCNNTFRFLIANVNICLFKRYDDFKFIQIPNDELFYQIIQDVVWMKSILRFQYFYLRVINCKYYVLNLDILESYKLLMKKIASQLIDDGVNKDKFTEIIKQRNIKRDMEDFFSIIRSVMDIYLACSVPCSYYTNIILRKCS